MIRNNGNEQKQRRQTDLHKVILQFFRYRTPDYGFYQDKNQVTSVQHGDWENVQEADRYTDQGDETQEADQAGPSRITGHLNNAYRSRHPRDDTCLNVKY